MSGRPPAQPNLTTGPPEHNQSTTIAQPIAQPIAQLNSLGKMNIFVRLCS